jgi:diguanylate cyclase (GGDEF)-like protein
MRRSIFYPRGHPSTKQVRAQNTYPSRGGPTAWLIICGIALIAAIAIGTAVAIDRFRESAIESGKQELQSAVLLLVRHFDRQFEDFAILQNDIVDELQSHAIDSADVFRSEMATLAVHEVLRSKVGGWDDIAGANVFDFRGTLINSSQRWPVPDVQIADRAYFKTLAENPKLTLEIEVVPSRFSGSSPAIVFARRISGPHGQFLGVVTRAISPGSLEAFFASTGLGSDASISMHHRDGALLARYPHVDALIGQNFRKGPAEQLAVFQRPDFAARLASPIDGKDRLIASRMLDAIPLVVVATKTVDSTLAAWRSQTKFFILVAASSILVITLTLYLIFRQIARELSVEKLRLDTAINNMGQGLLLFDASERLIVCNNRYIEMYGLSPEVVKPGCSFRDVLRHRAATGSFGGDVEKYCDGIRRNIQASNTSVVEISDGRLIQISNEPVPGGGWVATHEDVTERVRAEERIAHLAHYDALTDLPNRILFREHVERKLADLSPGKRFGILYIDVDEFKSVNDSLGHHVGDELLKSVALRLQSCIGPGDLVARLGGDEFAVVKAGLSENAELDVLAQDIHHAIRAPARCLGQEISADASIGIAVAPADGSKLEDLLKNADLAMYDAKSSGRHTYRFFAPEMDARMKARLKLESDLRNALNEGAFEVHYQPLLDLASNAVTGCEALLRWRHPDRGMISPAEFIPIAEETGLINELGEWVLRRACSDAAGWPHEIKLAVNVSPVQFKSKTLALKVAAALADSGLSPERLELEITEAVLIQDNEEALSILNQLRQLGVSIALDDFGTGYSSLSYLRRFPFDKIKIDRSFVNDITEVGGSSPIVKAVVSIASARNMTTTAEGVETEGQREILRELGCSQMQGYLFSPAVPSSKLEQLLSLKAGSVAA